MTSTLAILGAGNIGTAIARGLVSSGRRSAGQVLLTRRDPSPLAPLAGEGFRVGSDNAAVLEEAATVLVCVQPQQLDALLDELRPLLDPERHTLVSVVSGASIAAIKARLGTAVPLVRAMPNVAIAVGRSMTCLAAADRAEPALDVARGIFDSGGTTLLPSCPGAA